MKIELKSREGSVYKKLCNSVSEANSDTELIVPDSLEDILRILSCRRQCRIREKNVGQDAVSVSGEIDVTVMYIPETGDGVRVVGTTIPFEINFSAPGADSTSSAVTKLLALNADAKAVNPRKILISTSTVMELSCYKYSDVCWFEPPENAPDKLYFKTSELKCKSIVLVSEKTLSVEDELDVPEQLSGGDFVRAFSSIRLSTSEVVGTKLVVKGSAEIEAIYLVSGVPQTARFSLPFSQLFTMPDGCTDPEVIACDMITGQYFEAFDGKLSADIRAAIQIICLQDQSRSYICDAYSCKKELALSSSELSSIVASGGDAVASKLAKTAISTALPVVGGIISDAAGTVVAGAEAMRNTLGVFGMVALLAICVSPFAVMALNYIGYKLTAAAVKSFGCARLGELTGCIGSAVGMLLGLVGCCAMILFVSMAVSIKAVGG